MTYPSSPRRDGREPSALVFVSNVIFIAMAVVLVIALPASLAPGAGSALLLALGIALGIGVGAARPRGAWPPPPPADDLSTGPLQPTRYRSPEGRTRWRPARPREVVTRNGGNGGRTLANAGRWFASRGLRREQCEYDRR